jgi:hypothetical protein
MTTEDERVTTEEESKNRPAQREWVNKSRPYLKEIEKVGHHYICIIPT